MHPYRNRTQPERSSRTSSEELILYVLLVVIGAIPVIAALARRETLGVDATLGFVMAGAGLVGAIGYVRARHS